jgi:trehalose-6-phosphate synthase
MNPESALLNLLDTLSSELEPRDVPSSRSPVSDRPLIVVSYRIPHYESKTWGTGHMGGAAAMLSSIHASFDPKWLTLGGVGIMMRHQARCENFRPRHSITRSAIKTHYMISNEVLWPLLHDLSFVRKISESEWSEYLTVNRAMADAISTLRRGDQILINDYHFLMTPKFLNEDDLRSTVFFFHCAFPSFESLRRLPWASELIHSVSSCAAIGFQTSDDMNRFRHCQSEYGLPDTPGESLFVCSSTVDFPQWSAEADEPIHSSLRVILRNLFRADRVLLAVDRIDPVKGIDLRLKAFELVLSQRNGNSAIGLVQIAPPSRDKLPMYRRTRLEVEAQAEAINARYHSRVCLVETLLSQRALQALYRSCDGLVVSSRREGMNLVAQEFMACRPSGPGSLLLSEYTGLAFRIPQLGSINPYDTEGLAHRMSTVGETPIPEEDWNIGVELLRTSSAVGWAQKVVGALEC